LMEKWSVPADTEAPRTDAVLYSLAVPCLLRNGSTVVVVVLRHNHDYDSTDEMCMFWLTKILGCSIDMHRDECDIKFFRDRLAVTEEELVNAHNECDAVSEQLTFKLNQSLERNQEAELSCLKTGLARLSSEVRESLKLEGARSPFNFSNVEDRRYTMPSGLDVLAHCAETTFSHSQVEVWSSTETTTRVQDMDALLLDTKERVNRDSMTIGNMKIVLWEESAVVHDGHGAAMHIKAVITNPDMFQSPVWVKIRKHEDEFPDIYKVKILYMMKSMLAHNLYHLHIKDILESVELSKEHTATIHSEEMEAMEREVQQRITLHEEEMTRSRSDVEDAKRVHEAEIAATKAMYKAAIRDSLRERLVVNEYLNKIAIAEKFILSCGTITRSDDKKTPKKLNIVKMVRKVCEVLNQDGLLDVAAAQVKRVGGSDQGRKGSATSLETTHLTWISPSTHWVGTSSPMTSTSPIGTAYVSKRLVMTAMSEQSRADVLEGGSYHPKIEINPNDFVVMVTEALPDRTLIVPVTFQHHEEEILIVIKPLSDGAHENAGVVAPASLTLSSWTTIRTCLVTAATLNHTIHFDSKQRRVQILSRMLLQSSQRSSEMRLRALSRGFSCLKATWMTDRLSAYSFDDHKYAVARKHIRVLERSVADWTELVKGVNGASSGVALGLPGLWSQACRPLMSMITSHVTLRGCGLMVASEDGEMMDLNVEALSSMDDFHQDYSNDRNDIAATVSIRPATEMGVSIQSLALNILNGQTMASDSGSVQRLWKLSRTEAKGMRFGINEQMWLVPLRTATEVLGIVRVFVDVSTEDSKHEHQLHNYGEFQDYSEESSTEYAWAGGGSESAKRNLINFAEVLAPLVTAARLIEMGRSREQACEEDVQESVRRQNIFRKEIDVLMRRVHLVSTSVEEVHRALVMDFSQKELSAGLFDALGQRLEMPLSIALGVDVKMLQGDIRADEVDEKSSTKVYLADITIDKDEVVGYLRALLPAHSNDMDANNDSIILGDATLHIADSFTAPSPSYTLVDEATIVAVLDTVAASISATYLTLQRELEAREKVTKAVENLHAMQHELDDQIQLRQEFSYKEVISSETSAFNLKVADIMRACANCDSGFSWEEAEIKSIAQQVNASGVVEVGHATQNLLKSLCEELSALFGRKCIFNMGIQQHIPLLEDSSDDPAQLAASQGKLVWYSAEKRGQLQLPRGLVAADGIQIIENLATSCISRNRKSNVDIEIEKDHDQTVLEMPSSATMKVLTYPLKPPQTDTTATTAIGVLQVLLPVHFDKSEVESLCEEICETIAGVIRNDRARSKLVRRIHDFTTSNAILTNSLEESSRDTEIWRQKFTAWNAIALALKGLAQDCQESLDGVYKLLPTDMRAMLKSYGITLVATKSGEYDSDDSGVSQSGEDGHTFVLKNDRNGGDLEMLVMCRFNDETIPREDHEPLFEVLREYICCLHELILSRKRLVVEHEEVVGLLTNKVKASQHEVALANDQCRILSEKLQVASSAVNEQSDRITSMKGRIPRAIQGVLQPLAGDIGNLMCIDSEEGKPIELSTTVLEMFFIRYAAMISTGVGRVLSKRTRPFHVSVLVKTAVAGKAGRAKHLGSGVVMFDGVHATGITYSDAEFEDENSPSPSSESALYRGFTSGEAQTATCHGKVYGLNAYDLIGISAQQLNSLSVEGKHSKGGKSSISTVMAVPLHTDIAGLVAVVRVVYSTEEFQVDSVNVDDILKTIVNLFCSLSRSVAYSYYDHQRRLELELETVRLTEEGKASTEGVQHQLSKFRKIYKVVSREINTLFDPPVLNVSVNGVLQKLPSHPAALSPLVALQDTCLKTLSVVRSLAHSEGQAILLKDPDSTANTYQIICTGNALSWTGVEAGSFGMVSVPSSTVSLASTCIKSHKTILVANATAEKAYTAGIDGTCADDTPIMLVPIRGRGSGVVGVLMAARTSRSRSFTVEDAVAVELACSFGSLSLFWSSGLGFIHQKLSSSVSKIEDLEKSVRAIKNPSAAAPTKKK
jgi:hypothetical protein